MYTIRIHTYMYIQYMHVYMLYMLHAYIYTMYIYTCIYMYMYLCIINRGLNELSEILMIRHVLIACLLPCSYGL